MSIPLIDQPFGRAFDIVRTPLTTSFNAGTSLQALMARLAHASPQAAMVYQRASLARDVAIAERLAQMAEAPGLTATGTELPAPAPGNRGR